ncbi:MAG TPA: FAD-dependent oxidoreductase, partial [Vicinamibacterales bacterium]
MAGQRVDVAIIGSGFSGTLLALALRRRGRSVALVEAGRHPRFAIGESSTPLANLLLEEIADEYDLPRIRPLSKWSTWRRTYPELPVGLKRGFSFFHHRHGEPFADGPDHARQLLVAASPHDGVADTHWYRADFDAFLAREAVEAGAELFEETRVVGVDLPAQGDATLDLEHAGTRRTLRAGFVVDASGPRGALSRLLRLPKLPLRWLPPTQALYTHFEGVARWDSLVPLPAASCQPPATPSQ